MRRLWFLAHALASTVAAWLSFRLITPDRSGDLNVDSQIALSWITRFYVVQIFLAGLLFWAFRRSWDTVCGVLLFLILLWTALMFGITEFSSLTL